MQLQLTHSVLICILVKLRNIERKNYGQQLLFKETGACWRSNGHSRERWELWCSSREYSEAIWQDLESLIIKSHFSKNVRWASTMSRLKSFKNCKFNNWQRLWANIYFDFNACSYRGFYSRKYEHDFYARKKYLHHVESKNDEVRKNLDEHNRKIA